MLLEPMGEFFARRLAGYDEHMRRDIAGAASFYPATAALLPAFPGCRVLDLGCGTGLELEDYFRLNPQARVTGIDLSREMLDALEKKFPDRDLELICGSYLELSLGKEKYDAAVSVESLHHLTPGEKLGLYRRLWEALIPGGYFILTDYFAVDDAEEAGFFRELAELRRREAVPPNIPVHFDIPLTPEHELELLRAAGFRPEALRRWGATALVRADK